MATSQSRHLLTSRAATRLARESRAIRRQHCLTDNGNGTVTVLINQGVDGFYQRTFSGRFPTNARVILEQHAYTPDKDGEACRRQRCPDRLPLHLSLGQPHRRIAITAHSNHAPRHGSRVNRSTAGESSTRSRHPADERLTSFPPATVCVTVARLAQRTPHPVVRTLVECCPSGVIGHGT